MSKASEAALGELHAAVATTLAKIVSGDDCTAAHLGAAITFLKNNSITADADTNEGLKSLKDKLDARRKDSKNLLQAQQAAARELEDRLGGEMGMMQ